MIPYLKGMHRRSPRREVEMRNSWKWRLGFMVCALVFTLSSVADAQSRRRGRRKLIKIDVVKIEGRIQKPQAFYILQRSSLNFEGLELKNSFVPKIIKSVDEGPF